MKKNSEKLENMTTVRVNAKKNEVSPMTKKLMGGLNLSLQRLLTLRCRSNGTFCFCDAEGNIYTMKARELRAMMVEE